MKVHITRLLQDMTGTYGVIFVDWKPCCLSLEPVIPIPEGHYVCEEFISGKFGKTFKLLDVPGYDNIEFHWGNTTKDTKGCILTGSEFGELNGISGVLESKKAFERMISKIGDNDDFLLEING